MNEPRDLAQRLERNPEIESEEMTVNRLIMTTTFPIQTEQYASCVEASKRVRWDIDRDVIRGRDFDMDHKLLPDSISGIQRFEFLDDRRKRDC